LSGAAYSYRLPENAGDKCACLDIADADGIGVSRLAEISDVDVETARRNVTTG
jgi:hypothetical protein